MKLMLKITTQVPSSQEKAKLLDTNAAAPKKYRESFSPKAKAQMLTNNAAAHKKQQESLSSDKKLRF
jgi:hypothetical protein